jgi:tRNA pseudouridine55 synthase
MARIKKGREISGIIVLNKPLGLSSNQVLQKIKWLLGAKKAGHTGALDPMASGVLPLCFGDATKFSQVLLESSKGYITTCKLGEIRSTGDQDGEIVSTKPVPEFDAASIEKILQQFRGLITQVPPMYSALKHEGRPLYELARKGIELDLKTLKQRQVTIHSLQVLAIRQDVGEIDLEVVCSKGTYIRSLVEDIGNQVGCGAYVSMLHRTQAGPFSEAQCIDYQTLLDLEEAYPVATDRQAVMDDMLIHSAEAIPDWPKVELTLREGHKILHGQRVKTSFPLTPQVQLWVNTPEGVVFVGVGDITDNGTLIPKRVFQVKLPSEMPEYN